MFFFPPKSPLQERMFGASTSIFITFLWFIQFIYLHLQIKCVCVCVFIIQFYRRYNLLITLTSSHLSYLNTFTFVIFFLCSFLCFFCFVVKSFQIFVYVDFNHKYFQQIDVLIFFIFSNMSWKLNLWWFDS